MQRRRNLQILFNNTSMIPFKFRGKFMCFYCGDDLNAYEELRKHTKAHGMCSDIDRAIRLVKSSDAEVKIDVSEITCEICKELFPSFDEIVTHLIFKHKLPYIKDINLIMTTYRLVDLKCLQCDETFDYMGKLITHVNNSHPSNCFTCDTCKHNFNKKRDLHAHLRSHHRNEYNCLKCALSFDTFGAMKIHKANAHTSVCNICFETFSTAKKRLKHMKRAHEFDGKLQCLLCFHISQTKQAFLRHASNCNVANDEKQPHHSAVADDEYKGPDVKLLRINIACIFNMSTAIPFKHFRNRFRCFYCSKDFTECEELKEHTILEHPVCDKSFKAMKLHNRKEENIKVDTSSLSCKMCYEPMLDLDTLIDHITSEHKAQYDKSIPNIIQPFKLIKNNFACPFCGDVHSYFNTLLKHISRDHTENRKICLYCGKSFRGDPSLRVHVSRHHKAARYKCSHCNSRFTCNNDLHIHMGMKHGEKFAKCPQCPEKFTSRYLVQSHLMNVHGTGFKCSYCDKLFPKHSFMTSHVRRLHLKEKNVECSICFERFFDARRLKMHMVKHIGERNFHCGICDKKFLWKKNLRRHMAAHSKHATS